MRSSMIVGVFGLLTWCVACAGRLPIQQADRQHDDAVTALLSLAIWVPIVAGVVRARARPRRNAGSRAGSR